MTNSVDSTSSRCWQAFPRAEIHTLAGVGHWSWLAHPEEVAAHVVPFLRSRVGTNAERASHTATQGE